MGMNLDQILAEVRDGWKVGVTLVTNQDNGIATYARGSLVYHAATMSGGDFQPPRMSTGDSRLLEMYFSDRTTSGENPDQLLPGREQLFYTLASEKLYVRISLGQSPPNVAVKIPSWGGGLSSFATEERGNLLIGLGPSLGNSPNAVWVIAFTGTGGEPR